MIQKKIICIDFDGTCVTHEFPRVGKNISAVPVLKELVGVGHKLILFTMRSNIVNPKESHLVSGNYLSDAIDWFKKYEIPLYGIQVNPTQYAWTTSPKAYGHLYIDDSALGCPLIYPSDGSRPYVDWIKVRELLVEKNYLTNNPEENDKEIRKS